MADMGFIQNLTKLVRETLNLNGHIDTDSAERAIRNNIEFKGPNAWILAVAVIIASVGLNVNSIPVVIGAMLISPLMGPIFGLGLGLGVSDIQLMKSSGKNLLVMVSISMAVAFLYFLITPLSMSNPTELLARTSPTFYDVLIALFGARVDALQIDHVLALLIDLGNDEHAEGELELTLHTFAESEHIVIDDMTMPGICVHKPGISLEEI